MRLVTILGTRPELIRLSLIIPKLDELCEHTVIHTGQNYDYELDGIFFEQLNIRKPDYYLGARGTFGEQAAVIFRKLEDLLMRIKPDAFLVLGDTNSSLGAVVAKRLGIRVFHMEAGNRCFDDRVPEEVNRRIIDHSSDILMPYTERSRQNLLDEGIHSSRIYVTGNPMREVIDRFADVPKKAEDSYYLVTLHRQENVDDPDRLAKFIQAFSMLDKPVKWSVHPRTRDRLGSRVMPKNVEVLKPLGFLEFVQLERNAYCVLTDSGTVQEECSIFGVPVVTLRDTTERPETIESGSNFISGCEPKVVLRGIDTVLKANKSRTPTEYLIDNVSDTVTKIVLSYYP